MAKGFLVCLSPQAPGWVTVLICLSCRYVIECPNCGVVYRSRQYWFGNQDPVDTVVRTEIVHVWPGVRTVGFLCFSLSRVVQFFMCVENWSLLKIKVSHGFQNVGGLEWHDLESFFVL